jgi:predicted nucleotidyltransferase
MIDLTRVTPEIESICKALPVKRLAIFGSALTEKFGVASDIDMLVVFDANMRVDLFAKYGGSTG